MNEQPFLKCDAKDCDHLEYVADISDKYIGKECPLCGESLLTQKDYDDWINFAQPVVDLAKLISDAMLKDNPDLPIEEVKLNMHNDTLKIV